MKQLQINVTKDNVTLVHPIPQITTGEYCVTQVSFDFSEEWNDKIKKARFGNLEVDIVNDACYFPIILKSGVLPLKVYGYTQTTVNDEPVMTLVYSPTPTAIHVYKGSYDGTRGSNIPTPSGEEEYMTKNILWGGFSDYFNSLSDVPEEAQAAFDAVNVDEMTAREVYAAIETIDSLLGGHSGLIDTEDIADGAVTGSKLEDGAVTSDKIADNAVVEAKINNAAVTSDKIASGAVTSSKIAQGTILASNIADNAIKTSKINPSAVTNEKLATGAVTSGKIGTGEVYTGNLADNSVKTVKINNGAVTTDKISNEAVTRAKLAPEVKTALANASAYNVLNDEHINFIAYSHTNTSPHKINTAEEYIYNCNQGYTAIKGDLRLTSDNKIIMCHDAGFTFDGNGKITTYDAGNCTLIHDMTYAECMAKQHSDGTYVCDFETYIAICKRYGKTAAFDLRYDNTVVDVNTGETATQRTITVMLDVLDKYNMRNHCLVACDRTASVQAVRSFDSNINVSFTGGRSDDVAIRTADGHLKPYVQIILDAAIKYNCIYFGFDFPSGYADRSGVDALDVVFDVRDDNGNLTGETCTALEYAHKRGLRFYECVIVDNKETYNGIEKDVIEECVKRGVVGFTTEDVVPDFAKKYLSELVSDSTHRTVTDVEKTSWNHIGDWNTTAQGDTVSDVIGNWKEVNSTFSTIALVYVEVITSKEGEYSLTVRNTIDTVIGVYINGQQCYDFSFNENTVTFNNPFEWEDVVEIQYYAQVKNIADIIGDWSSSLNGRSTLNPPDDYHNKSITQVIGDWNGKSIKSVVGDWTTQNNGTNIAATIGKWFKQNGFNTITDVVNGKYTYPTGGIPENDLSADVQNRLNKAYHSVQPTDLENYYTKASVDSLINALTTLDIQVVQTLPSEDISTTTIYLLPKSTIEIGNVYDEYIYVSNSWEKIGTTEIDLSNYYTKPQSDGKFLDVSSNQSITGNKSWNDNGVATLVVSKGSSSDGGYVIANKVTSDPLKPVFSTYYKSGKIINDGKELTLPADENGTLALLSDVPDISGKQDVLTAGDGISIQGSTISATLKKYTGTITGDGTTTSFTITHNFGTRDVLVNVYDGTTYEDVIVDVERTTENALTIMFGSAPSSSQTYKVVVIG